MICDHCSCKVDGTKFFNHIVSHRHIFTCSKCVFKTKNVIDLILHEKDDHRINSLNYHCHEFSERLQKYFFNSKVVFGNGLVLTNHNFKNTIYDDSKQFDSFLDLLIEKMKETFYRKVRAKTEDAEMDIISSTQSIASNASNASDQYRDVSVDSSRNPFRVSTMPCIMTELEQQNQLDNNISILGFPRSNNEDLLEMFMKLCNKLKVNVAYDDVSRIYRNYGVNEPVIVRFRNYDTKILLRNSAHLKDIWSNDLFKLPPEEQPMKICISIHTTRFYGKMVSIAREARKSNSLYSYYLCKRGLVVKRTENSKERAVLSATELMDYIYGDTKYKQSNKKNSHHSNRSFN